MICWDQTCFFLNDDWLRWRQSIFYLIEKDKHSDYKTQLEQLQVFTF